MPTPEPTADMAPGPPAATRPPAGATGPEPGPGGVVTVHRVSVADAARVRALRLEMLADSPLAFLETLAQAAARPHVDFRRRIAQVSAGDQQAQFVAELDGRLVGNAGGVAAPDDPGATLVFGVYVTPGCRGTGILARLVEAVAAWSRAAGRPLLVMEVVSGNTRAMRAYHRLGFVVKRRAAGPDEDRDADLTERRPHPTIPGLTELVMTRPA